mmetsp:Transcript_15064/g.40598  ORF Transcript_15064/g.40598 Transcript_15064/m.40598 type:complete len:937 (+) Transcript_15064:188-2998(+)
MAGDSTGAQEIVRTGSHFGPQDDQFELGEELGSGAAARVYVCKRLNTGEQLAAKVINLHRLRLLGDFEAQITKLNREVQILRELQHPRIVRMHNVYRTQSFVFLVMELVRGGELFDRIVQNRCLNEAEAKYVFRQLLEGVGYMHSRHVIHRDLKPENVLIAATHSAPPPSTGTLLEVKIADFGLSKIISDENSWAKTFVGTPQYWAPEVLKVQGGEGSYTHAVDFWSLGAVLFVMLCGRYPFDGKKMPLEEQIRSATYNMNTAAWQKVSEEAKSMVRGLLVVNPAQRLNLDGCRNHPWFRECLGIQPTQYTPLARTTSSSPGMIVAEVSSGNVASNAVPIVSQPSNASDISNRSGSRSGSTENVGSPKMSQETPPKSDPPGTPPQKSRQLPSIQMGSAALGQSALGQAGNSSGMPHETIFCLNELLKLQVSIAGSLEMAALAFRHTDMELAEAIRKTFWQARDLSSQAVNVVSQYAQVAQQVGNDVLPDLELAIQEKEPSLATMLLGMVKEWVADMKKDGQEIQRSYHGLQESVHSLIQRAQHTKFGADMRLAEALQSDRLPPSPRSQQRFALTDNEVEAESHMVHDGTTCHPSSSSTAAAAPFTAKSQTAVAGYAPASNNAVSYGPGASPKASATAGTLNLPMNHWTRQLFEQLSKMQANGTKAIKDVETEPNGGSEPVVSERPGGQFTHLDSEAWKRDVLDLLFMAPGAMPSQLPKVESVGNFESEAGSARGDSASPDAMQRRQHLVSDASSAGRTAGGSDTSDLPISAGEAPPGAAAHSASASNIGEDALVRFVPGLTAQSPTEAMTHLSASLLRALRELKRVDEILEGCSAFWANMDSTVQKLTQMKEHTECLVNFAAKSKPLRDRFEQRLTEYRNFWSSLERLCRQYCLDHQASAKRMYEVIREVSDAADVIDTANSARLGLLNKQRRHGY